MKLLAPLPALFIHLATTALAVHSIGNPRALFEATHDPNFVRIIPATDLHEQVVEVMKPSYIDDIKSAFMQNDLHHLELRFQNIEALQSLIRPRIARFEERDDHDKAQALREVDARLEWRLHLATEGQHDQGLVGPAAHPSPYTAGRALPVSATDRSRAGTISEPLLGTPVRMWRAQQGWRPGWTHYPYFPPPNRLIELRGAMGSQDPRYTSATQQSGMVRPQHFYAPRPTGERDLLMAMEGSYAGSTSGRGHADRDQHGLGGPDTELRLRGPGSPDTELRLGPPSP